MFRIEHEQPAVRPHRDRGHIMVVHLTEGGKERWGKTAGCVVVGPDPDVALAVKPADEGLVYTSPAMHSGRNRKPRPP